MNSFDIKMARVAIVALNQNIDILKQSIADLEGRNAQLMNELEREQGIYTSARMLPAEDSGLDNVIRLFEDR